MNGACSVDGEGQGVYRILVGKSEEKRPVKIPRLRWEDIIKMALEELGYGSVDWIGLAQDRDGWQRRVAGSCECGNEPSGSIKCGVFLD
jgi:hypothetical protein